MRRHNTHIAGNYALGVLIMAGLLSSGAGAAVSVGASLWTWQNPLPQGNRLNAVSCPTSTTCFAVGDLGTILVTTDSGSTWSGEPAPTTQTLHGISCVNSSLCFAVGDGGTILATSNGTTWTAQGSGTTAPLSSISCGGYLECVAVGGLGTVLLTEDGLHWSPPITPPGALNLVSVSCTAPTYCLTAGSWFDAATNSVTQGVWQSFDLNEWSLVFNAGCAVVCPNYEPFDGYGNLTSVYGQVGSASALVLTDQGYVLDYSGNFVSGVVWSVFARPTTAALYGLTCSTSSVCYAVGNSSDIYLGTFPTLSAYSSATPSTLYSISCPTNTCFAVGAGGAIVWNPSGGTIWESLQTAATSSPLLSTNCPAEDVCFAVGWNGTILATTNGGGSWARQFSGVSADLQGVDCANATTCVAVGAGGTILTTTGLGWYPRSSGTSASLNAVNCPTTLVCFAAGAGVILATSNGGSSWSAEMSPPSGTSISDIACTGSSTCIAVGSGPVILTTANGFSTWARQNAPTSNFLNAVACPSSSTCFAVGNSGVILISTNGGSTWSLQTSPTSHDLTSISCVGSTCYAGSSLGDIISTYNFGANWGIEAQVDPNTDIFSIGGHPPRIIEASGIEGLSCAQSSTSYQCMAVGSDGTMLSRKFVFFKVTFVIGSGELTPADGNSQVGEPTAFQLTWTVPGGKTWRSLKYLDLRLADDHGIALWARFIQGNPSAFALLDSSGTIVAEGVAGAGVLDSPTTTLDLAKSSFESAGATSPAVTVNFVVDFKPPAAGNAASPNAARVYHVQLLATDVAGDTTSGDVGHWTVRSDH